MITEITGELTFVTIGDPHFKSSTQKETDQLIKNSLIYCKNKKPGFIVVLGDVINVAGTSKSFVDQQARAFSWITKLGTIAPTIVLIGNHDMCDINRKFCKEHSFQGYENENVVIVDDPVIFKIMNDKNNILKFLCMPYMTPGTFLEEVDSHYSEHDDIKLIFAHQELKGVKLNSGMSSKIKEYWPIEYPLLITGHQHVRHILSSNCICQGAPYSVNHGEEGEKVISYFKYVKDYEFLEETYKCVTQTKIRKVLNISDAINLQKEENVDYKLVIKDSKEEIKKFKSSLDYLTIKNTFDNIEFIIMKKEPKEKIFKTFLEDVNDKVKNIPSLEILWNQTLEEIK